jgi:hypothetical protein
MIKKTTTVEVKAYVEIGNKENSDRSIDQKKKERKRKKKKEIVKERKN